MTDDEPTLLAQASERIGRVVANWRDALRDATDETATPITPRRMSRAMALGVELIHEGWLLHATRASSRLIRTDAQVATTLLVGDWCFAAGLCDVAENGDLDAIETLAQLIARLSADPDAAPSLRDELWSQAMLALP